MPTAAACFRRLDVSDESNWEDLVAETMERFGRIDVLINNAAVLMYGAIAELPKRAPA